MRRSTAFVSRSSRFLFLGLASAALGCTDSTTPSAPSGLAFIGQPAFIIAGALITPAVVVAIQDENGNTVTSANTDVTLEIAAPSTATLLGTTTVAAVNGIATFSNLTINVASPAYRLVARAANLSEATSSPFPVGAGLAAKLGFIVQPITSVGNVAINPSVQVAVQDALGNTVTNAPNVINLNLAANSTGATLFGQASMPATNGIAVFVVGVTAPGAGYTLTASSSNLTGAASAPFDVTFSTPARLAFATSPWVPAPGISMSPAVRVVVQDANGNTVGTANNTITLAIGLNPAGGTLSGTTTVAAVNGTATFSDLRIDNAGVGYTLFASTSPALTTPATPLFTVRNPLTFTMISAGYFHSCGLATGNVTYCWGINTSGELGNPAVSTGNGPVPVSGGQSFVQISAGRSHTCGLTAGGLAYCWGANFAGQIGNGTTNDAPSPTQVLGGLTFAEVAAGYDHTCGVTTGGAGYCWGGSGSGELGNTSTGSTGAPLPVSGGLTFASISPGRIHTCGVTTSGAAYCWGDNSAGMLGDGTEARRTAPMAVGGGHTFSSVSAGGFHSCGVTTAGAAYCWGSNFTGQLGTGSTSSSLMPVAVSGGLTFATFSAGNRHTCGATASGVGYCWGEGAYLGEGTGTTRLSPALISGGHNFVRLSAGRFHGCGLTAANEAYCWGDNFSGALGGGEMPFSHTALRVR